MVPKSFEVILLRWLNVTSSLFIFLIITYLPVSTNEKVRHIFLNYRINDDYCNLRVSSLFLCPSNGPRLSGVLKIFFHIS